MNVEELLKEAFESYTEGKAYDALIYLETVLEMDTWIQAFIRKL